MSFLKFIDVHFLINFVSLFQCTKVMKLRNLCDLQTDFIINLMEITKNKNADSKVLSKSLWIFDYLTEISASINGPKKSKQVPGKYFLSVIS